MTLFLYLELVHNALQLAGQTRHRIGRLNPDGSLELAFDPGADNAVSSLALRSASSARLRVIFPAIVLAMDFRNSSSHEFRM